MITRRFTTTKIQRLSPKQSRAARRLLQQAWRLCETKVVLVAQNILTRKEYGKEEWPCRRGRVGHLGPFVCHPSAGPAHSRSTAAPVPSSILHLQDVFNSIISSPVCRILFSWSLVAVKTKTRSANCAWRKRTFLGQCSAAAYQSSILMQT